MTHSEIKSAYRPCTGRTIIYNVLGVASIMASQFKKVLLEEKYSSEIVFDYKNNYLYRSPEMHPGDIEIVDDLAHQAWEETQKGMDTMDIPGAQR